MKSMSGWAVGCAQSGTDPYTIQRLMGHKSFVTTQRYAHHYSESLRKGYDSGLPPPCLRFAVLVTPHHARLGA